MKKETRARLLQERREKAAALRVRAQGDAIQLLEECVRRERADADAAKFELVGVLADIAELEREVGE